MNVKLIQESATMACALIIKVASDANVHKDLFWDKMEEHAWVKTLINAIGY